MSKHFNLTPQAEQLDAAISAFEAAIVARSVAAENKYQTAKTAVDVAHDALLNVVVDFVITAAAQRDKFIKQKMRGSS